MGDCWKGIKLGFEISSVAMSAAAIAIITIIIFALGKTEVFKQLLTN